MIRVFMEDDDFDIYLRELDKNNGKKSDRRVPWNGALKNFTHSLVDD